jgi:hypothetical protein
LDIKFFNVYLCHQIKSIWLTGQEDFILTYFWVKWGLAGLYIKDEKGLADYIGVSVNSLRMQAENFRFLMGKEGLSDVKKLQVEVYEEWGKQSLILLRTKVRQIIDQDNHDRKEVLRNKGVRTFRQI